MNAAADDAVTALSSFQQRRLWMLDRLYGQQTTHDEAWRHARLRELTTANVVADLTILSSSGQVVATLAGFCLRQITREAVVGAAAAGTGQWRDRGPSRIAVPESVPIQATVSVDETTRYLRQKCAELSGHAEADIRLDVRFTDLGLDSIAAMRLSNHLMRDLGCTVTLVQIFTCPSLESLARAIGGADNPGRDVERVVQ